MTSTSHKPDPPDPPTPEDAEDKAAERSPTPSGATSSTAAPPPSPPPPKGPRILTMLIVIIVGALVLWIGTRWGVRIQSVVASDQEAASQPSSGPEFFTCGMHPSVILPGPGICPICQMDLTPIDPDKFTGEVSINPVITQNIGVRIEPVRTGPLVQTIRTVGTIDYDETTVRDVNIKVPGWIEELYVDYLGAEIEVGDPLFDFYSPDLYVAQEAYLRALADLRRLEGGASDDLVAGARNMVESARTQLDYYDVEPAQIDELAQRGAATKTITVHSPHRGVVIAKHANEGMRVDQGMQVYRIADLAKVWVMVALYEYQLPYVQAGQHAVMKLPYIPGQEFEGEVIYVYPYLDKMTRQVNVRLEFENPHRLLKPGMYANVELHSTLADERTLVPRSAVIDTGERQIAFVSLGEGRFEPRPLRTGVETGDDMIEVLDGLRPGEMVVTSAQFLIDSEANIREGLAKMIRGELASEQEAVVASVGASELSSLPNLAQELLGDVLDAYFAIGDTLASDSIDGVPDRARALAGHINQLLEIEIPEDEHFWHEHDEVATVRGEALELIEASDIAEARSSFAALSVALSKLTRATGIPEAYSAEIHELHCPMYREGQGGSIWLQPKGTVRNPFFGSVMLECFDERSMMPVTGATDTSSTEETESGAARPMTGPAVQLDDATQTHIDTIHAAYLLIHDSLTRDSTEGFSEQLQVISDAAAALADSPDAPVAATADRIASLRSRSIDDPSTARTVFEEISIALTALFGVAPPSESMAPVIYQVYCPMEKKSWLQTTREVANPYMPNMPTCGSVTGIVAGAEPEGVKP